MIGEFGEFATGHPDVKLLVRAGWEHGDARAEDAGAVVVGDPYGGFEQLLRYEWSVSDDAIDLADVLSLGGFDNR